jgi:predicted secreted protein
MSDMNVMARRVMVANAVVSLIPGENLAVNDYDDRLARLTEHLGALGYAHRTGCADVADELLKVAATAFAWIDQIGSETAR